MTREEATTREREWQQLLEWMKARVPGEALLGESVRRLMLVLRELLEAYVEENGGAMPTSGEHPAFDARKLLDAYDCKQAKTQGLDVPPAPPQPMRPARLLHMGEWRDGMVSDPPPPRIEIPVVGGGRVVLRLGWKREDGEDVPCYA
jgi:hypothetical protein